MKKFIFIAIISILLSCSNYKINTLQKNGTTVDRMQENWLGQSFWKDKGIQFNLHKYKTKEKIIYYILIETRTDEWLFIKDGKSLELTLGKAEKSSEDEDKKIKIGDWKKIFFEGNGSIDYRKIHDIYNVEKAWYPITKEEIKAIAFSNEAVLKLVGEEASIEQKFSEKNFSNIRFFYKNYVK